MKKVNISQVDTLFANGIYPIEFLFFFDNKISSTHLIKALEKIAKSFWPVFGIYQRGQIIEQQFLDEDFFSERTINKPFDKGQSEKSIYESYQSVNPQKINKLFFLTAIQFSNGTALIPKMSHLAGDGYSYFYFMMILAAVYSNLNNPLKMLTIRKLYSPLKKRTRLSEFLFDHEFASEIENFNQTALQLEYLRIAKQKVKKHIRICMEGEKKSVSQNDVLCAIILKKFAELNIFDKKIKLTIPVDIRQHIKEFGPKYFGNGLKFNHYFYSTEFIVSLSVEELAIEIRQNTPAITRENYTEYLRTIENYIRMGDFAVLRPFNPEKDCLVTNLSKMPVSKIKFNGDQPALISTITKGKNSVAILADGTDFILRMMY